MYKGLTQNLQAAIASGKNPDVVQMGWSYLNYAAENLKYTDLQPMIEKQAPEDKNFLKENYLPNVLALAQTDDGKQIGIPYSIVCLSCSIILKFLLQQDLTPIIRLKPGKR